MFTVFTAANIYTVNVQWLTYRYCLHYATVPAWPLFPLGQAHSIFETTELNATPENGRTQKVFAWSVLGCGLLVWVLFTCISLSGGLFRYEVASADRPIVLVTSLYIIASIIALIALAIGLAIKRPSRDFLIFVVLFSLAFRLVQLSSPPFQEIDCYRYLWDGTVVANGYSPYKYSPRQILNAEVDEPELHDLRNIAFRDEGTYHVISRIHFAHIRTIYPPVSQAVFAAAVFFVPQGASVDVYLLVIKTAMMLFDLGTLGLLIYLLFLLRLNPLWCMAYGWNPLIVKEFSNSGHLDSIAVFFAVAALTLLVRFVKQANDREETRSGWSNLVVSSLLLACGFAAKIYPVILLPLCLTLTLKAAGWTRCLAFGLIFSMASLLLFWPMASTFQRSPAQEVADESDSEGLTTFLRHWQMNEWAYMLVYQNLKEINPDQELNRPWFRIIGESTRKNFLRPIANRVGDKDAAYTLSRVITLGFFSLFYLSLLVLIWTKDSAEPIWVLSGAFWVVAIFFCLQPTQNPWYWTWAMPLIPFTRVRGWLAYSTFLFIYYFRFSLKNVEGPFEFLGCTYSGQGYFDHVIVWAEHLPVFLLVGWQVIRQFGINRQCPPVENEQNP